MIQDYGAASRVEGTTFGAHSSKIRTRSFTFRSLEFHLPEIEAFFSGARRSTSRSLEIDIVEL